MTEISFSQITLGGDDNYIVIADANPNDSTADLFHFAHEVNRDEVLKMLQMLSDAKDDNPEKYATLRMMTGNFYDELLAVVFKEFNSSRCHVFTFAEEEDFRVACALAERYWQLENADEIADDTELVG